MNPIKEPIIQGEHPWVMLETPAELEGWMELNNQELQKLIGDQASPQMQQMSQGQGICLTLLHGGEIYFHTNSDGDVLLDVTADAEWVAPVITACTKIPAPKGQIWLLPQHVLMQLLMGLNPLIASSRLVLKHAYRLHR
ncbi:hypothetical protein [Undibacterium sp.]|uniref:hypothetical protein n=1 Tax=Undibacterium sp. TaxID=1914977 RepID=UPI003752532E